MSGPQTEDTMIAALLREREGLVQRGLTDRVAQVDEQLRLRVHKPQEPTPDAQQEADAQQRAEAPKGRQPRGSQKA